MNSAQKELHAHWHEFCDADPFPGSDGFVERMEAAGLIELVPVTDEALESAFSFERGIEAGGMMWQLTSNGRVTMKAKDVLMNDLIKRLEAATGPDRDLDVDIAFAVGHFDHKLLYGLEECHIERGERTGDMIEVHVVNRGRLIYHEEIPRFTGSIDTTVATMKRILPGWGYRVASCCVSDDASVWPDFNCHIHGERLRGELDESIDWFDMTDVDLRPPGREAIALCMSVLIAKQLAGGFETPR